MGGRPNRRVGGITERWEGLVTGRMANRRVGGLADGWEG